MIAGARDASRIPSLDGLRAISIGLVLEGHLTGTRGFPLQRGGHFPLAELGVRVFFVISGYLITTILLGDLRKRGRISLGRFYFRRALRLFPALYVFLGIVLVLAYFGFVELRSWDVAAAIGYAMNYHRERAWVLGHCWSLSVEEQFYFLWPALLVFLGAQRAIGLAALFLFLAPVIRVVEYRFFPAWRAGIGETFPTIADTIATGCVLAGIRQWLHANAAYNAFQRSFLVAFLPLVVLAANYMESRPSFDLPFGQTMMNVGIALIVDWVMRFPDTLVGRVLNSRPLVIVGVGSYSLYIWQQIFLNRSSDAPFCAFPLNIALAGAVATASYLLIEKPFLRLREKLELRLFSRRPRAAGEPA
jgi:peptidoglycan/LPS O-acetylase OafA/YrhL